MRRETVFLEIKLTTNSVTLVIDFDMKNDKIDISVLQKKKENFRSS